MTPLRTPSPPSPRPSLPLLPSASAARSSAGKERPLDPAAPAGAPQPVAPSVAGQQQPQAPESVWWGTRPMGPPAVPVAHSENQEVVRWMAAPAQQQQMGKGDSPMEHILDLFSICRIAYVMNFEVGAVLEDAAWQAPEYCFNKEGGITEAPADVVQDSSFIPRNVL